MDDLISRKRLLRDTYFQKGRYPETPLLRMAISEQPAVEAVPLVRALWCEYFPSDCALIMTGEEMLLMCSHCGAKYSNVEGFRYCPHCGAFMEGVNNAKNHNKTG